MGKIYEEPTKRKVRVVQATTGLKSKSYYVTLTGNEINYNVTGEKLPNGKFKFKITAPENFEIKETNEQGIVLKEKEADFLERKTKLETREHVKVDEKGEPIKEDGKEVKEKDYDEVIVVRQEVLVYDKLKFKHSGKEDLIDRKEEKGKYYYEIETDEEHFSFGESSGDVELLTDLESYYKLDETTGTTATDAHGSNNGTASNSRVFTSEVTGILNTGADFTQGSDQISTNARFDYNYTDSFSISTWVYIESGLGQQHAIIGKGVNKSNAYGIWIVDTNGDVIFEVRDSGINRFQAKSSDMVYDEWVHIVAVYDAGDMKVYVNNQLGSTTATYTSTGDFDAPVDVVMGLREDGVTSGYLPFIGSADEVGIWSKALNTDEISELYNSGSGLSYDDFETGIEETDTINLTEDFSAVTIFYKTFQDDITLTEDITLTKDFVIRGQVTLGGAPVENAKLFLINDTDNSLVETKNSDSGGYYFFDTLDGTNTYHVVVQYESGGTKYNAKSKPFLTE